MDKSEFAQHLDTLKQLGIKFSMNWAPTKEEWQNAIFDAGYNITAHACNVIVTEDTEFLYASGAGHWDPNLDKGCGPRGVFLLSRSRATGRYTYRTYHAAGPEKFTGSTGVYALKRSYPGEWPMPLVTRKRKVRCKES